MGTSNQLTTSEKTEEIKSPVHLGTDLTAANLKKTFRQLKNSYPTAIEIKWDKVEITAAFTKLINSRDENFNDYNLGDWLEYWRTEGYSTDDVVEMLTLAIELPAYAGYKLTIGSVISNWKKETGKARPWDWAQFKRMFLVFCKHDIELFREAYKLITGLDLPKKNDREKISKVILDHIAERNDENFIKKEIEQRQETIDLRKQLIEENEKLSELQKEFINERIKEVYELIYYDLLKVLFPLFSKYKNTGEFEETIAKFFKNINIDHYLDQLRIIKKFT